MLAVAPVTDSDRASRQAEHKLKKQCGPFTTCLSLSSYPSGTAALVGRGPQLRINNRTMIENLMIDNLIDGEDGSDFFRGTHVSRQDQRHSADLSATNTLAVTGFLVVQAGRQTGRTNRATINRATMEITVWAFWPRFRSAGGRGAGNRMGTLTCGLSV